LIALVIATAVSCVAIVDWATALPKLVGLTFGLFVFVGAAIAFSSRQVVYASALPIWTLSLATAAASVALMQPTGGKFAVLDVLLAAGRFPIPGVSLPITTGFINPNEVAGVLVLLLPLCAGLSFASLKRGRSPYPAQRRLQVLHSCFGAFVTSFLLAALAITQSRSGLAAMGVLALAIAGAWATKISRTQRLSLAVRVAAPALLICLLSLTHQYPSD
jgi:hypothetical protein